MQRIPSLLRLTLWLVLAAITAWVWAASERAFRRREVPSPVVVRQDVVYRDINGHRLTLDIYLPPGDPLPAGDRLLRPAILVIHGGSWIGGSKRLYRPSLWNPHPTVIRLAEFGFVVVAADYRLARPGVPGWPAARDDLREAVRWVRRHARELGIDPGRIAALGQSAGAHLAAMLGTSPEPAGEEVSSRVQAVVDFYGPSDLERLPLDRSRRLAHDPVSVFLGDGQPGLSHSAWNASPINHVRAGVAPMLLIHGTRDPWVPIAQSEALDRALVTAGVMHRFVRVDGARHGFDAQVLDPEVDPRQRDLLPEVFAFLQNVWNARSR